MKIKIWNYTLTFEKNSVKSVSNEDVVNISGEKEVSSMKEYKEYSVQNVARYVVEYCINKKSPISNLQLQKILYYIQVYFLVNENGRKCFSEDILRWEYGPVVREAYNAFRKYSASPINEVPKIERYYVANGKFIIEEEPFDSSCIDFNDTLLIDKVVDYYREKSAFYLVNKTHNEDPWKLTNENAIIDPRVIQKYYIEHRDKVLGEC